ncbi:ATP-NAD kinase family protein [Lactobacillus selangorensis]|uniref:NAD kinase n=1 Tax=Lactobacillus selangorensis TaxID=81857 RepID=A0A0R2FL52_9LACO|nr:NAD kinase [Lactobacillus selangorensis]KRN28443.1 ATP-NAD kinase family protein [Lactobacillus selangorensis]KRN31944.1 ATP-NAD kinase family protein [Lactobacillus selangorensis]
MRIAIFNNESAQSQRTTRFLRQEILDAGFEINDFHPDIVITVGGDGTLLSAFHRYSAQLDHVRFIGVHTGHLGFYTDWRDYEIGDLVTALKQDSGESVKYPLLDVEVTYADTTEHGHFLSLNESTLKRLAATLRTDVYIKDNFFESFRGDGLCISTPTGSTAYSKSIGGAVLHPSLEALQLTEIASINNRVFRTLSSPIVIPKTEWITLKPAIADDYVMTVDQFSTNDRPIVQIRYRIADEKIQFARYRHTHFWNRVKGAFISSDTDEK